MNIPISDEQMRQIVSSHILGTLTEEARSEMLQQAVVKLMTPEQDPYDRRKKPQSILEQAFVNAVENQARTIAHTSLTDSPDFATKVEGLLQEAITRVFETHREKMVERVANIISEAIAYTLSNDD